MSITDAGSRSRTVGEADDGVPMALWHSRPVPETMSSVKLAAMVEQEIERSEQRLLTIGPRAELDEIGRSQQLLDQAFAHQVRVIVAAHARSCKDDREFVADELALALGVGVRAAQRVLKDALGLASLPGMVEAIGAGMLGQRHALAVLHTLDEVPTLTVEQRMAIGAIVLARVDSQTPYELSGLTRRLILTVDRAAAQARQDAATRRRQLRIWPVADGQATIAATGPMEQIAMIKASLHAWRADNPRAEDDPRTEAEREFDLFVALLTGGETAGGWQAQVIVPFSTVTGGELELAEIPGLGPVLPSTAQQLLEDSQWLAQVAVDQDGVVIAAGDPIRTPTPNPTSEPPPIPSPRQPTPERNNTSGQPWYGHAGTTGGWGDTAPWDQPAPPDEPGERLNDPPNPAPRDRTPVDEQWRTTIRELLAQPPPERLKPDNLGSDAYRTPSRLRRYLQARDRRCVFPGCHQRITDIDHRIPWPLGPTEHGNAQCLCRRHHRAKQQLFTITLTTEGHYLWTTRGGWQFLRKREGY
ncbi:MAG TPA: DUF222 domain-containing protein [Nonomuraea sp.]|nr:DUF222 domain-containing protein [Nonomuraea sp.]